MDNQEYNDLKEFLSMLDFEEVEEGKIKIVENFFNLKELPASIQIHIKFYLEYLRSVE